MKHPQKRTIHFHGVFKERYQSEPLEVYADSMYNLFNIIFKCAYPELLKEKLLGISFETEDGQLTELFDPEQELSNKQTIIHIYPKADGAELLTIIAIVIAVVAIGAAFLLAPKLEVNQETTSGANWTSPENVVGQGGSMPVILGRRRTGSRVASYGIDSKVFRSRV
jgi:predicted phage tail protein